MDVKISSRVKLRKGSDVDAAAADFCSCTRGQAIDLLERRQEAALLRFFRAQEEEALVAADDVSIFEQPRPFDCTCCGSIETSEFLRLSNAQIAEVMAGEQKLLESRIRRQVLRRRSA